MEKGTKTGLLVAGAVAGVSLVLLNSNARNKVKDTSAGVKNTVNKYAQTIKEDPQGSKDAIIGRIQNAMEISKEAINKIQSILDNQAQDIKDAAQNVRNETKYVKERAKDAGEDFQDVKDKAMEAKGELKSTKDDLNSGIS